MNRLLKYCQNKNLPAQSAVSKEPIIGKTQSRNIEFENSLFNYHAESHIIYEKENDILNQHVNLSQQSQYRDDWTNDNNGSNLNQFNGNFHSDSNFNQFNDNFHSIGLNGNVNDSTGFNVDFYSHAPNYFNFTSEYPFTSSYQL